MIINKKVQDMMLNKQHENYQDLQDKADLFAVYPSLSKEQKKEALHRAYKNGWL